MKYFTYILFCLYLLTDLSSFAQSTKQISISQQKLIENLEESKKYDPVAKVIVFNSLLQENKDKTVTILEDFLSKTDKLYSFLNTAHILYAYYRKINAPQKLKLLDEILAKNYQKFKNDKNTDWIFIIELRAAIYSSEQCKEYNTAQEFYQKYLEEAQKYNRQDFVIMYYTDIADKIYKKIGNYTKASEYNLKALDLIDNIKNDPLLEGKKGLLKIGVYVSLGLMNYEIKNFRQAIEYWIKGLEVLKKQKNWTGKKSNILNDIGISYRQLKDTENAFKYLNEALYNAEAEKDSAWIGIIKGNLGDVWIDKKDYEKAIPLLEEDMKMSLQYDELSNLITTTIQLGNCYNALKNYQKANEYYQKAQQLYKDKELVLKTVMGISRYETEIKLYEGFVKLYDNTKEFDKAYKYQSLAKHLRDSLNTLQGQEKISLMQSKHEFEQKDTQNKLLENNVSRQKLISWIIFLSALACIIGLAFFVIIYRIRLKNAKMKTKAEAEISHLKQQQFEENIALREREITEIKLLVTQKTNVLEKLETELALITQHNEEGRLQAQKIVNVVKDELNLGNDIDKFKNYVENTHADFFLQLSKQYPTLSLMDLRMCSYIRANMQNKEIAQVMNIKYDSLRVNKLRLRKKINVETEKELYVLLQEIKIAP